MWLKLLRGHAICAAATFITISGSQAIGLGAFAAPSLPVAIGLSLGLTVFASIVFWAVAVALHLCNIGKPGIALHTVTTSLTGALAIWLGAMALPSVVLVSSFAVALGFGFANALLIWLIAIALGSVQPNLKFWPEFRSK